MSKGTKTTVVLLVLFVTLVAVVVLIQRSEQSTHQSQQEEKEFVELVDESDVSRIIYIDEGVTSTVQRNEARDWVVYAEDQEQPLDRSQVQRILTHIDALTIQSVVSQDGAGSEELGFTPEEQAQFVIESTSAQTVEITVGNKGSIRDTFYARRGGDSAVYLVRGEWLKLAAAEFAPPAQVAPSDELQTEEETE
jgi:hypothetical protein